MTEPDDEDMPTVHVVEVGGMQIQELVNLVANDVIPRHAVVIVNPSTRRPAVVWTGDE